MNIGDKVKILECHKMPDLVGKIAKVVAMVDPEADKYPIKVILEESEAIEVPHPLGKLIMTGPFEFREDELEPADPNKGVPEAFQDA